MHYFLMTIYSVISAFGTVGNLLAIIGFWRIRSRPGFSPISCFFILCLASSDLVLCSIVIPMKMTVHWSYEAALMLDSSIFLCRFEPFLKASLVPFSTLLMTAVAVDRYLFLCRPADNFMTKRIAFATLIGLGGMSVAIGILASFMLTIETLPDDDGPRCTLNNDFQVVGQFLKYFQLGVVWGSVGVATTLYGIVYASVLRRRQTVWRSKRGLSSPGASRYSTTFWRRSGSRQTLASTASYFRSTATPSTYLPSSPSAVTFARSLSIMTPGQVMSSANSFIRNPSLISQNLLASPNNKTGNGCDNRSIAGSILSNHLNVPLAPGAMTSARSREFNASSRTPSFYMPGGRGSSQFIERRFNRALPPAATDASSVIALALSATHTANGRTSHAGSVAASSMSLTGRGQPENMQQVPNWQATYVLRKNIKAAVMLFTVTLVFVIFFMPATLIILNILPPFSEEQFELRQILFNLHFASSATNPFIYVFLNSTIRKEMKRLFQRSVEKFSIRRRLSRQESKRSLQQRRQNASIKRERKPNNEANNNNDQQKVNSSPIRRFASSPIHNGGSQLAPTEHQIPLLLEPPGVNLDDTNKTNTIVLETIHLDGNGKYRKRRSSNFSNASGGKVPPSILISVTVADDESSVHTPRSSITLQPNGVDSSVVCEDARFESNEAPKTSNPEFYDDDYDGDENDQDELQREEIDDVPAIMVNTFSSVRMQNQRVFKPVIEVDSMDDTTEEMTEMTETTI